MKQNVLLLAKLQGLNILSAEDFYSINITEDGLRLQRDYNSNLASKLKRAKWKGAIDDNGFAYFQKRNITIVLT